MKSVIVCGSVAIDFLGSYAGSFEQYQSLYPVKALNISLQLNSFVTSFGGCGMNITYGLNQLAVKVIPISAAGRDFNDHYRGHLEALGIDTQYIAVDEDFEHSAQCTIFSDDHGNQITAFHSGASVSPKRILPHEIDNIQDVVLAVLAPEDAPIMLRQARDLKNLNIPILFDPGQGTSEFSRDELLELLYLCSTVIANENEWEAIKTNTGMSDEEIKAKHEVIITYGADGVKIYPVDQSMINTPAVAVEQVVEATGCGDAFRAGYVFGLMQQFDTAFSAKLGCTMAAINIGTRQTQRYKITSEELIRRCKDYYAAT